MRNLAILLVLILATVGVWAASSAFLVGPLLHDGQSYPLCLHLAAIPDVVGLAVYAVWAFILGRLSRRLFSQWPYRGIALAFALLFFLFVRGVFIASNVRSAFLFREAVLGSVVAGVMFLGVSTATSNQAMQRTAPRSGA